MELLPWDCWGAMPAPGDQIDDDRRALFDHLAALTRTPDTAFTELRRLLQHDERLRVPSAVAAPPPCATATKSSDMRDAVEGRSDPTDVCLLR